MRGRRPLIVRNPQRAEEPLRLRPASISTLPDLVGDRMIMALEYDTPLILDWPKLTSVLFSGMESLFTMISPASGAAVVGTG